MTDLSPTVRLEMQRVIAAEQKRREEIARAWRYYDGDAPQPLVVVPRRNKTGIDDNVRVNFSRLLVDTGVHYLFGKPLGIDLDEESDTPEEEWLAQALPVRKRSMLFQKLANNGGVAGHSFARILLAEPSEEFPRVVVLDPGMVFPRWDPTDIERVVRWTIEFVALDPETNKPRRFKTVMLPNDPKQPTRWSIEDFEAEPDGDFTLTDTTNWPYPFSPIVHCQNLPRANEFYGAPDLEADLLDLQSAIDRVLSMGNKTVRKIAKPPVFAKGMTAPQMAVLTDDPDGMNLLPAMESEIIALDYKADLPAVIDFKKELVQHLREVGHLPEVASGNTANTGTLSSLALKVLFSPLTAMTEAKQNTYGELVVDLVRRLLVVGKQETKIEDTPEPILNWPEVVPDDPMAETQALLADMEFGASKATLLTKRGYDPAAEEAAKRKEQEEAANVGAALLDGFNAGAQDSGDIEIDSSTPGRKVIRGLRR